MKATRNIELMSTHKFSTLTGLTLRQLQYWDEHGLLRAKRVTGQGGNGSLRKYKPSQLPFARKLALFSRAGYYPRQKTLEKFLALDFHELRLLVKPTVVDGVLFVPFYEWARQKKAYRAAVASKGWQRVRERDEQMKTGGTAA